MIRRDMAEVHQIEKQSFEFPWSEEEFIRCLRQRNCIGMVAERYDRAVAFMIYELHPHRIHLLSLAVHVDHRRSGVGHAMIDKVVSKLAFARRNRITLEVRESNLDAQLFLKQQGFRAVGVLKEFYEETNEDAYTMVYRARREAEEGSAERSTTLKNNRGA
jgi:ribosomal-protein-alanine N-acetyltransferase